MSGLLVVLWYWCNFVDIDKKKITEVLIKLANNIQIYVLCTIQNIQYY